MNFSPHLSARLIACFGCNSQYSTGISTISATSQLKSPFSLFSKEDFFQLLFLHGREAQGAEEPQEFPMEAPALGDKPTFWEVTAKSFGFPGSKQPFDVMMNSVQGGSRFWMFPAAFISQQRIIKSSRLKKISKVFRPNLHPSAPVPTQPCHQGPPPLGLAWNHLSSDHLI